MLTVHFRDVGRDSKSWSVVMPELTEAALLKAVKVKRAILSRFPEFQMVNDNEGVIYAGIRSVGRFFVEEPEVKA